MPTVELYGRARILAGERTIHLAGATIREVLLALGTRYPSLIGPVISAQGDPTPAYTVNVNGLRFCTDMSEPVVEGDELLIISSLSGG